MKTQPISRRALAAGLALAPVAGLPALAGANSAAHMSQPRWRKRYSATGRHSRHSIPVATATRKLMQRATSKAPPVGSLPFPPVKASRICLASSATFSKVNAASVARLISSKNSQASSSRSMRISIPQTTLKRRHDHGDGYRSPRRGRAHCSSQAHLVRAHRHEDRQAGCSRSPNNCCRRICGDDVARNARRAPRSPRRHDRGASPVPAHAALWLELWPLLVLCMGQGAGAAGAALSWRWPGDGGVTMIVIRKRNGFARIGYAQASFALCRLTRQSRAALTSYVSTSNRHRGDRPAGMISYGCRMRGLVS